MNRRQMEISPATPPFCDKDGQALIERFKRRLYGIFDIRRERLHRLIVEVMHSDLWNNPDATRHGWCSEFRKEEDYNSLLTRCHYCGVENHHCITRGGLLMDNSSKLEFLALAKIGTRSSSQHHTAFFQH